MTMEIHATTILCLRYDDQVAIGGDGQVTFNDTVLKAGAVKVRKLHDKKILAGFAGAAADAMTLFERFEAKIEEFSGNLPRAAVEMAKEWRTDKYLRRLEALLAVADKEHLLLLSGTGEIVEPDDGIIGVGSGGPYALAAARALISLKPKMKAEEIVRQALSIASEICVYTNKNITVETI